MYLSGQQRKELQNALINAFPKKSSLEQMLDYGLDKKLFAIAGGDDLREIVFNLIKKAEAENWVRDLITAALKENPENPKLKNVAKKILGFNLSSNEVIEPQSSVASYPKLSEIPVIGNKASEVEANYTKLRNLLEKKEFGKADLETLRIILWISRREKGKHLNRIDIENFPELDLHTMNQLWLAGSDGKFGFSVQKKIWIEIQEKSSGTSKENFDRFTKKVIWVGVGWSGEITQANLDEKRPKPEGHLPVQLYTALMDPSLNFFYSMIVFCAWIFVCSTVQNLVAYLLGFVILFCVLWFRWSKEKEKRQSTYLSLLERKDL